MRSLFRNRFLKVALRSFFLIVVLVSPITEHFTGEHDNWIALTTDAVCFFSIAAFAAVAGGHALYAGLRRRYKQHELRQRFLCPHCLTFEDFQFSCGSCGARVEELPVLTHGDYVNDCPKCHAALFSPDDPDGREIRALCGHCGKFAGRGIHHNRSVRVLATFDAEDFAALSRAVGASRIDREDMLLALRDDGRELTYVVNVDDLLGNTSGLPRGHMICNPDVIWLDKAASDPLKLGREVDRFLRIPSVTPDRLKALTVMVTQSHLDAATLTRLEMLGGTVRCNVASVDLATGAAPPVEVVLPEYRAEAAQQTVGGQPQ